MNQLISVSQYVQTHALSVLLAVLASFIVGFLWHGPLFGKQWMKYNKLQEPKKEDFKFSMMVPGIIASLVMAFVQALTLSAAFQFVAVATIAEAFVLTVILWFAFVALVIVNEYTWAGKSIGHIVYDVSYYLASMLVIAAVVYSSL